jgi:hypothetical protein
VVRSFDEVAAAQILSIAIINVAHGRIFGIAGTMVGVRQRRPIVAVLAMMRRMRALPCLDGRMTVRSAFLASGGCANVMSTVTILTRDLFRASRITRITDVSA